MITINCLYFASLKEATGTGQEQLTLPSACEVGALLKHLETLHPGLQKHAGRYQVAVQQELVDHAKTLRHGDEVALIPPVSGGAPSDSVRLLRGDIEASAVLKSVERGDCGALVLFLGTVRDFAHSEGRPQVESIDYSAYEKMAEKEMQRLVTEVKSLWDLGNVAMWHRLGSVPAGATSVAVAVSSCHRQEAFEASRWLIDQLKLQVPLWKKEIGPRGEVWIEGDARIPTKKEAG